MSLKVKEKWKLVARSGSPVSVKMADLLPESTTQLESILDLLQSTGSDQCRDTESPASVRIVEGLVEGIRNINPDLVTGLPQTIDEESIFEASKCIVDALELMGCPSSVEACQIQKIDPGSIYPVVKWLVSDVKTQQGPCRNESRNAFFCNSKKNLTEVVTDSENLIKDDSIEQDQRKTCLVNELKDLRDRIRTSGADSVVPLLQSLKAFEREEANAKSNYDMKKAELETQTAELEAKASCDSHSLSDDLDRLLGSSMEKLHTSKMGLAAILRAVLSAKLQLDDVPSQSELMQYECRLSELNTNIGDKHGQTRKYFATYNALMEIKELMLKEISLLNSINSQFQDAITSPEGQTKLIRSMEGILKGIQQKLEKVQLGLHEDQQTCSSLRKRYAASVADQRRQFTLSKSFQEESTKNERLRAKLAAKECHTDNKI